VVKIKIKEKHQKVQTKKKSPRKVQTKKKSPRKVQTKKKISNFLCRSKNKDICCEKDYDRDNITDYIIEIYKSLYDNEYLEFIDNDIVKFIGYRIHLENEKNNKGLELWDSFSIQNEEDLKKTVKELPLYYLLAFLGHAHYTKSKWDSSR
jgi:hypothetical protein